MTRTRTAVLVRAALVAALIAVGALVAIPIGPVPITLQVFVLATAALVLTPREALIALVLYVALGAAGIPVFAGGGAGFGILLGPTGGFIVGFAVATPLAALVRTGLEARFDAPPVGAARGSRARGPLSDSLALVVFLGVTYAAGFLGFMVATGRPAVDAVAIAIAPFVLIDAAKCVVALGVARAVRAAGAGAR